jgi:hypothetical protein
MLPLLCAIIVFLFLAVGAAVFVVCWVIPPLQRYGLSAALWCVVWGPFTVAWLILAGLILIANHFVMQIPQSPNFHLPALPPRGLWSSYAIVWLMATSLIATLASWIHQKIIHRMTMALFRIYAGLVSAAIGSVWGWCLCFWLINREQIPHTFLIWISAMTALCVGFGYAGFRWASRLRGDPPKSFPIITKEEFEGTV